MRLKTLLAMSPVYFQFVAGCAPVVDESRVVIDPVSLPLNTFDEGVARAQSAECQGKWTTIGTCDGWLVVIELTGYTATWSFYDPLNKGMVASRVTSDTGEFAGAAAGAQDPFLNCLLGRSEYEETDHIICEPSLSP